MPKPSFWFDFQKIFNKARKPRPPRANIYRWLTLGMTLVVAATVLLGGLPAIGLIWWQLDRQVELRVLSAQSSTQALYTAEQRNFLQLIQLVSERPTLCALIQRHDIPKLTSYLEVLRQNSTADSLAVVTADGQMTISGSVELPPEAFPDPQKLPLVDFVTLENPPRLAIFAASEVASAEGCEKGLARRVIAIRVLDHDFLQSLARDTGLEQSLLIGDRRVATSFTDVTDWPLNPEAALQVLRTQEACCTKGASGGETYYVGLAPLLDNQGRAIALSEVALPANTIRNGIINTTALFLGIGILVALAGTGLALLLTRRITRPLRTLTEAAERMGAGDLETPVPITSGSIAIDGLASQLERSRRNLQQIQRLTRRELRRIVHLLGATREGVITISMDGIVTWANSDACHMLGYDVLDLLRKHYLQIFRPAPREIITVNDVLRPTLGQAVPNQVTILNAQDSSITLAVTHSSLDIEDEDPRRAHLEHVLILRDVSEEQAINRLRSEFLGNVAHEFRTPLSAISALTEMLVDEGRDMSPEELSHLAHTIRLSTIHLQTLVNNLLESAIIEAGVFRLRYRPLQVQDVLRNIAEMMSPLLQRRQQRLEVEASEDLPCFWGDPDRLNQALVNLVENAGKFSPSGAAITLSVRQETDTIAFAVLDSGPGLPTERFGDLFNRFVTGDRPRGAQYGIGLGLPIVKAIAEAHGGRVGAENRPEGGARVWFTIPLRQQGEEGEGK